jgi:hypothetical protein
MISAARYRRAEQPQLGPPPTHRGLLDVVHGGGGSAACLAAHLLPHALVRVLPHIVPAAPACQLPQQRCGGADGCLRAGWKAGLVSVWGGVGGGARGRQSDEAPSCGCLSVLTGDVEAVWT